MIQQICHAKLELQNREWADIVCSKSTPMVDLPDLFSLSWLFKVKAVLGIYVKKNETLANV